MFYYPPYPIQYPLNELCENMARIQNIHCLLHHLGTTFAIILLAKQLVQIFFLLYTRGKRDPLDGR